MISKTKTKQKPMKCALKSQVFIDRHAQEQSILYLKLVYKILLLLFFAVVIYILFFSPFMQISRVEISGNQEIKTEVISAEASAKYEGVYLGILPKNNFIIFPAAKIEELLKDKFKKIDTISVSKFFPDKVQIVVRERESLLVWCNNELCYMIDENGIAYELADLESQEIRQNHLVKLIDNGAKGIQIGDRILEQKYMEYILAIKDLLNNELAIEINDEYLTPSTVSEEVRVKTTDDVTLMFSTQFELKNSIKAAKIFLAKKNITKDMMQQIEYIDLRGENKVFYKMRNQQTDEQQADASTEVAEGKQNK